MEPGTVWLLRVDPDLGCSLPPSKLAAAKRAAHARVTVLTPGPWRPASRGSEGAGEWFGAFVLSGLLTCQIRLRGRHSLELLGPGDLLRPPQASAGGELVAAEARWRVAEFTQLALLDAAFLERTAHFPELVAELVGRAAQRTGSLALRLAIAQIPQISDRLLVLFWHLADRFGTVHRTGVALPLRLSNPMLGDLVCAQPRSVARGLRELAERGIVTRNPAGTWRLRGGPA